MTLLTRHKHAGISYLTAGKGTPLLLLHGIPGSSNAWERVGIQLSDHYHVIIPDLMGFG
ncbi:MAG: alpha/beta fold hydrolase, partial [Anaerolineae bacterium]|nr:alpha/beta fold hydrolase [Anaerolineae bacterium]